MTVARRSRSTLLGAILALVASLSFAALSGWHGAAVQDDDPVHATSVAHVHGGPDRADPDGPIHTAAHAVGQWLAPTKRFAIAAVPPAQVRAWMTFGLSFHAGIAPPKLLRPPRG